MSSYNHCTFIGNLGRDPELRYTPAGKAVCNFSIAVSNGFGEQQKTLWVRVSCWEKTAETAAKYLQKGKPVMVAGKLEEREWTDAHGEQKKSFELVAFTVVFLGAPSNHDAHSGPPGQWNREGGSREGERRAASPAGRPPAGPKTGQRSGPAGAGPEDDIPY